jgi:hypothetical protein
MKPHQRSIPLSRAERLKGDILVAVGKRFSATALSYNEFYNRFCVPKFDCQEKYTEGELTEAVSELLQEGKLHDYGGFYGGTRPRSFQWSTVLEVPHQ